MDKPTLPEEYYTPATEYLCWLCGRSTCDECHYWHQMEAQRIRKGGPWEHCTIYSITSLFGVPQITAGLSWFETWIHSNWNLYAERFEV
jgi:hypothetical protein